MMSVQYIRIPFVSAYDIYPYIDAAGLSISTSGTYTLLQYATDNFVTYNTGYIYFVSGSGFWQGSGYTNLNVNLFSDTFNYNTGFYTGIGFGINNFLQSGSNPSGYFALIGITTGYVNTNINYFSDTFENDQTGIYGFTGFIPINFINFAFSGALAASTGYAVYTGLKTLTGTNVSGYASFNGPTIGSTTKNITIINSQYISGNNLAYLSGYFVQSIPCQNTFTTVFTSGYSGYGSGLQFMGAAGTTCIPGLSFIPTGSGITFSNGTLEVRFNRTNNYMSGLSNTFSLAPNYICGREPLISNYTSILNGSNARILGRASGDGIGFNQLAYGAGLEGSVTNSGQTSTGCIISNTNTNNGMWYTISCVSSGLFATMYINGIFDSTGAINPNSSDFFVFNDNSHITNIGLYSSPSYYGIIDEIRIWDNLRNSGDIYANWNKTVSPYTGNLAVLFRN